jgi:hypothetical protein
MAQWFRFNLIFIEPKFLPEELLTTINKELKEEDYDVPEIFEDGCDASWRSPNPNEEWLQAFFQKHGIDCKFQFWEVWDDEERPWNHPWFYSSKIAEIKEKLLALSEDERVSLFIWLDGKVK